VDVRPRRHRDGVRTACGCQSPQSRHELEVVRGIDSRWIRIEHRHVRLHHRIEASRERLDVVARLCG
jgi:hypothetical protein